MLKVVTYNILHGYHPDSILKNIAFFIKKGVSVFCLQEADVCFEKPLKSFLKNKHLKNWRVQYARVGLGGNLAVLWDASCLSAGKFETLWLPCLPRPPLISRLKGHGGIIKRGALVGTFVSKNKIVRVVNCHLAWEGGIKHRLVQLNYLKEKLPDIGISDVIAGDFNTFAPSFLRRLQQVKVESLLGPSWKNVLPDISWSCDVSYSAPQDKWETVVGICRLLDIKLQSRLDYIFVRNVSVIGAKMIDLPGSDHRPLMVSLR
ncbi:MAG TPA: hypothetical protein VJB87_01715 [Candidatus Nanoarchaeia archaeon]|nr:hypothetical protein [Candidatus Nanoarchaeia archaeon]